MFDEIRIEFIYYELLKPKQTVSTNLYSQQLTRLIEALRLKQSFSGKGKRKVILLHDNARPVYAKTTRESIEYSPRVLKILLHFIRSMQH